MVAIKQFEKDGKFYPIIELKDDNSTSKFGFTFGVSKAKLIVKHYEEIKKFVNSNSKEA